MIISGLPSFEGESRSVFGLLSKLDGLFRKDQARRRGNAGG